MRSSVRKVIDSTRKKSTARAHINTILHGLDKHAPDFADHIYYLDFTSPIISTFLARADVSGGTSGTILRLIQSPDGDLRLPPDLELRNVPSIVT